MHVAYGHRKRDARSPELSEECVGERTWALSAGAYGRMVLRCEALERIDRRNDGRQSGAARLQERQRKALRSARHRKNIRPPHRRAYVLERPRIDNAYVWREQRGYCSGRRDAEHRYAFSAFAQRSGQDIGALDVPVAPEEKNRALVLGESKELPSTPALSLVRLAEIVKVHAVIYDANFLRCDAGRH